MNQIETTSSNTAPNHSMTDTETGGKDKDKKNNKATIGHSVKIHGDLSGNEDLIVNGTVEGTIDFRESDIIVGEKGKVNANVTAKNIIVYGEVKGELRGSEQVTIKPSGHVVGDIRAPRVILNDGCQFKGMVDMEDKPVSTGEPRGIPRKLVNKPFPDRTVPTLAKSKL